MSSLVDKNTKVITPVMTGDTGTFRTRRGQGTAGGVQGDRRESHMIKVKRLTSAATVTVAALSLSACATTNDRDWGVTPASAESVVIMHTGARGLTYDLRFSQEGQGGFGRRIYGLGPKSFAMTPYAARTLKPGTYVLNSIVQQGAWSTCFTKGTLAFTIQPGGIYYLGEINSAPLLMDLQRSAMERGRTSLTAGSLAIGWEPAVQPVFALPTEADLTAVRAYVAKVMPRSTAPVEALSGKPASFTATSGERAVQVCG